MRASSSCHCANCGSWARNQVKAERISGNEQRWATSCCTPGKSSDTSACDRGMGSVVGRQSSVVSQAKSRLLLRPITKLLCHITSRRRSSTLHRGMLADYGRPVLVVSVQSPFFRPLSICTFGAAKASENSIVTTHPRRTLPARRGRSRRGMCHRDGAHWGRGPLPIPGRDAWAPLRIAIRHGIGPLGY